MRKVFLRNQRLQNGLLHLAAITVSLGIADLLQFDFAWTGKEASLFWRALLVALPVKMLVFALTRLHWRWWWELVDWVDLNRLLIANAAGSLIFVVLNQLLGSPGFPWSIYCIDFLLCFVLTAGIRFSGRMYKEGLVNGRSRRGCRRILIYGAGEAGMMLLREIRGNFRLGYHVAGFLDDDPQKTGAHLLGVPVLGKGSDAARIVEEYKKRQQWIEEVIIAAPSATGRQMQDVLTHCRSAGIPCKTIPTLGELLNSKFLSSQIRSISLNDLLGREPVHLDESRIRTAIAGRVVLVTGAAGSIGSEICFQIARFGPRKLVALDQAESELFKIDLELREKFPALDVAIEIGDIQDGRRVEDVFRRNSVDSVFHAAAYKHVPMMEFHVLEAAKNNILGTWNVVQASFRNRVSSFLMISSDKAVNPTNVMGATKRIAEVIVSGMPGAEMGSRTRFVSVRFGNVLGSNGSVVPIFQKQIAGGGPVTVTHPEARRYFMTVREAVQLVLQASTMGQGSEIFVLDMGEQIRIVDLARNMIRLVGFDPDKDIEIQYVGLRPGEKLFEEFTTAEEDYLPTHHEKIKIFQGPRLSPEVIATWIAELKTLITRSDALAVVAHMKKLVPEYVPTAMWSGAESDDVAEEAPLYVLEPLANIVRSA